MNSSAMYLRRSVPSSGISTLAIGLLVATSAHAMQVDIPGPPDSVSFGASVAVLANGNIVVTDPGFSTAENPYVGAVYLYNGAGSMITRLTGSTAYDLVGIGGIVPLPSGNFLVRSSLWSNNGANGAGAVTWIDGRLGLSGVVSAANSLVGSVTDDHVGGDTVTVLANGNFVIGTRELTIGGNAGAGAATWGDGRIGVSGITSAANSLVGSIAGEHVGFVTALANGNYVVASAASDTFAGAMTWCDGNAGRTGTVSAGNSLISLLSGIGGVALSNGNFVVIAPYWSDGTTNNLGAVTWMRGDMPTVGAISATNSLVGTHDDDRVGSGGVTPLGNGNYVVQSPWWSNDTDAGVGAATWADGETGLVGAVSAANSLVGSTYNDQVGYFVTPLVNGNYVVASPNWDNGATIQAGAVTWADGASGLSGFVSPANSLVGTIASSLVGERRPIALANGNYVVDSPSWRDGSSSSPGAVTWADGDGGISGAISAGNSAVGVGVDRVGSGGVTALANGHYVISSPSWQGVGAATWANGNTGLVGAITSANSLTGEGTDGFLTDGVIVALSDGNYVIGSSSWNGGLGAATWASGTAVSTGSISTANSLVGSTAQDQVGSGGVIALPNGYYAVKSGAWDDGAMADAGAVTFAPGGGLVGPVLASNSVIGRRPHALASVILSIAYDPARVQLVVGQPAASIVSLFSYDVIFTNGTD